MFHIQFKKVERSVALREFQRQISLRKILTPDQYHLFSSPFEPVFYFEVDLLLFLNENEHMESTRLQTLPIY
jgi:hypothetical protein